MTTHLRAQAVQERGNNQIKGMTESQSHGGGNGGGILSERLFETCCFASKLHEDYSKLQNNRWMPPGLSEEDTDSPSSISFSSLSLNDSEPLQRGENEQKIKQQEMEFGKFDQFGAKKGLVDISVHEADKIWKTFSKNNETPAQEFKPLKKSDYSDSETLSEAKLESCFGSFSSFDFLDKKEINDFTLDDQYSSTTTESKNDLNSIGNPNNYHNLGHFPKNNLENMQNYANTVTQPPPRGPRHAMNNLRNGRQSRQPVTQAKNEILDILIHLILLNLL